MKSNINLYSDEFKPHQDPLSLNRVFLVWIVSFVALASLVVHAKLKLDGLSVDSDLIESKVSVEEALVSELQKKAVAHSQDPEIKKQLAQLNKELNVKRQLLKVLAVKKNEDGLGYSGLMYDFSAYLKNDLWLTEVEYGQKFVYVKGELTSSRSFTIWLSTMKKSPYFAGKKFTNLSIKELADKDVNEFEISTGESQESAPLSDWFYASEEKTKS